MPDTPAHLGGHQWKTHVDVGSLRFMMRQVGGIYSMVDIGCGPGGQVRNAIQLGLDAIGVDGDPAIVAGNQVKHDFTEGPAGDLLPGIFDLAWSCEFLEHVEERFLPNVMELFKRCRWAVVTAAPPGKGGHHHVNCQDSEYWIERFSGAGFEYRADLTQDIRKQSTMGREFMRNTGLVFENKGI